MSAVPDSEQLARFSLFSELAPVELERLRSLIYRKSFATGVNVFTVEQRGDVVYLLVEGTVKVYVDQIDGSEVILAFLGPGDTFGEMGPVDSAGRSASVLTVEPCVCLSIERSAFDRSLRTLPGLAFGLARLLSGRLRLANEQIQALSSLDVRGRVARQFLAFAQRYGEGTGVSAIEIPLRLTQTDIASLVGASRERVNQVIVDFKENGYLAVDSRHRFTVLDVDALVACCE